MEDTTALPVLQRLRVILVDRFGIEPDLVAPETKLKDIGIDSFALIELLFLAEEAYQIKIPIEGVEVGSVGDLVRTVEQRLTTAV